MLLNKIAIGLVLSSALSSFTMAKEPEFTPSRPRHKSTIGPAAVEQKTTSNGGQTISNTLGMPLEVENNYKPNDFGHFRLKMDHKVVLLFAPVTEAEVKIGSLFRDPKTGLEVFEFGAKVKNELNDPRIAVISIGTGSPIFTSKLDAKFTDKDGKLIGHLCGNINAFNVLIGYIKNSDKADPKNIAIESEAKICGGAKIGEIGYLTGDAGVKFLNANQQLTAQAGIELSQIGNTAAALSYRYRKDYFNDETNKSFNEYGSHRVSVGVAY